MLGRVAVVALCFLSACASVAPAPEVATVNLAPPAPGEKIAEMQAVPLTPPDPGAAASPERSVRTNAEMVEALMSDPAALDALGTGGATIDDVKRSGGGPAVAGGGVLSMSGGDASLLGGPSSPRPAASINGKPMKDATAADVAAAVRAAGCAEAPVTGQHPRVVFAVACGDRAYELTFVAADVSLDEAARERLQRDAAFIDEGGALLVIRPSKNTDTDRAALLLRRVHAHPDASAPVARASLSAARVEGSAVDNAGRIVAGMAAGVRRCFRRGLSEDPKMAGAVEITMKVGPNGEVLASTPGTTSGNVSSTVVACIAARGAAAQFSPPSPPGDASVRFTATLTSVEP